MTAKTIPSSSHQRTTPHPHAETQATADDFPSWHCSHFFYSFDRQAVAGMTRDALRTGRDCFQLILDGTSGPQPKRMQPFIVSGHKADFGLMVLDEDPLVVDRVHQQLMSSPLGIALVPTYSFVSITEVSEYLPTTQQYAQRLIAEGMDPAGEQYRARVDAYAEREPVMRRERLNPDLPKWPAMCFYPMNKKRQVSENWFMLDLDQRQRLMSEHAKSGMAFAGRVSQLITVSLGLDDWEWGVTLWAQKAQYLKDIVYKMRFDEASARYGEFGAFFTGFQAPAEQILSHCGVFSAPTSR